MGWIHYAGPLDLGGAAQERYYPWLLRFVLRQHPWHCRSLVRWALHWLARDLICLVRPGGSLFAASGVLATERSANANLCRVPHYGLVSGSLRGMCRLVVGLGSQRCMELRLHAVGGIYDWVLRCPRCASSFLHRRPSGLSETWLVPTLASGATTRLVVTRCAV